MDGKQSLKVAEVKAATHKKPYIKPCFEVINLEDTPILLAASGNTTINGSYGTKFRYQEINNL